MSQNEIQSPVMPRSSKVRPALFSLLILFFGIVIGAGTTFIFVGSREKNTLTPLPEEFSRRMVEHLTRELALTPEQQTKVASIIEPHMKVLDEIRNEARPKIRQELNQMNAEISSLLDENQKEIWNDRIKRMQENFSRSRQRRGSEQGPGDRRLDERRPGPDGQAPRRFHEPIPGRMPPPPEGGQGRPDSPSLPPQPEEPIVPPAQG